MFWQQLPIVMKSLLNDLFSMIKQSTGTQDNIMHITKFCIFKSMNSQPFVREAAKMFQTIIIAQTYMVELKLIVLQVITQIFIEDKRKLYIRHLSTRIPMLINNCKHQIAQNSAAIRTLKTVFNKWRTNKVFSQAFYNKIITLAGPKLIQKMENQGQIFQFTRYNKTSLLGFRDVDKVKSTSMVYKTYTKSKKLNDQVKKITNQKEELQKLNDKQCAESMQEMLKFTDKLIQQHLNLLIQLQEGSSELVSLFKDESKHLNMSQQELIKVQEN